MVTLFDQNLTRRQVEERAGMLSQFAGVRLVTLDDGVERGIRLLEFRTGAGLMHADERRYDATFRVLDGAEEIAATEAKIKAVSAQPTDEFPQPSGNHIVIAGRS